LLWESGSGQDIPEVSSRVCKRRIPLTAGGTNSLVISSLWNQAEKEEIAISDLHCDFLSQQGKSITNIMGAILKQLGGGGLEFSTGGLPKIENRA